MVSAKECALLIVLVPLVTVTAVSAAPTISYYNNSFYMEVPQFTILHFSLLLNTALIYIALRAKQKMSFSPGFIFVRLARGPPEPNPEKNINTYHFST